MKSRLILFALLFFVSFSLFSQTKAKFKFEEETFDFGSMKEENGPVVHKFVFTNEEGKMIDKGNWRRRVFYKATEKAEVRRIRKGANRKWLTP